MAHILIIDDDELICELLRRTLESAGYRVTEASEGRKGLAAHQATPADLVITDLVMPGMEGIEAIMEFRRRAPKLKIIAMSGGGVGSGGDYLRMASKFGATRTLFKPFMPKDLLSMVAEVLGAPPAAAARPA